MLKGRKTEDGVQLFNPYTNLDYNFSDTTWQIIELLKKYPKEQAVKKIMEKFNIDRQNAEEDIETILENFDILQLKLEDIPSTVSNVKYAPRTIHFDVTARCNQKCIYCYASDRLKKEHELSTERIIKLIEEMAELNTWAVMISGGEPFLRKDILEILENLNKFEISVSILTNGTLITDDIAKKLSFFKNINMVQVSLDSYNSKIHNLHRGVEDGYEKTLNGVKNLIKYGITPHIEVVITKINLDDIEKTLEFLHELGIKNVTIGPTLTTTGRGCNNKEKFIFNPEILASTGKRIIEINEKYGGSINITPTREFLVYSTNKVMKKEEIKCGVGKSILYISPEGLVYPCLFSVHDESLLGDLKKQSLSYIWEKSKILKKFREQKVPDIDKCKTCDFRPIYDLIVR